MRKAKPKKPNETQSGDPLGDRSRAMGALLSAPSTAEAATLAGVSRVTLWRWQQEPAFAAELRAARDAAFTEGLSRLKAGVDDAVGRLRGLLDSDNEMIRLNAAKAVIDGAVKAFSVLDVDERLRRIEDRLQLAGETNANNWK